MHEESETYMVISYYVSLHNEFKSGKSNIYLLWNTTKQHALYLPSKEYVVHSTSATAAARSLQVWLNHGMTLQQKQTNKKICLKLTVIIKQFNQNLQGLLKLKTMLKHNGLMNGRIS